MSLLRHVILPMCLGLFLAPVALAGDDKDKSPDAKGQEQTIRGVISGVTVLGEADIDYATRKATTAEATYLTVIGHPSMNQDKARGGEQASSDKARQKDSDVKPTAHEAEKGSAGSADRPRRRMNVYVVAVSPKTKICEMKGSGKDGSAAKEEACELDKLEIGDHVEVCFNPKPIPGASGEQGGAQASSMKHGRHRTYFGVATEVKIREETSQGEQSSPKGGENSSSTEKPSK